MIFQVLQPSVPHLLKVSFSKRHKLFHCTSLVRTLMKEKLSIVVLHGILSTFPLKLICRQIQIQFQKVWCYSLGGLDG